MVLVREESKKHQSKLYDQIDDETHSGRKSLVLDISLGCAESNGSLYAITKIFILYLAVVTLREVGPSSKTLS